MDTTTDPYRYRTVPYQVPVPVHQVEEDETSLTEIHGISHECQNPYSAYTKENVVRMNIILSLPIHSKMSCREVKDRILQHYRYGTVRYLRYRTGTHTTHKSTVAYGRLLP